MARSRTPLTYKIVPQDMDSILRRRGTGPQQRHQLDLVCTTCNKKFNRKFDLNRHVALHLPKDEQRWRLLCAQIYTRTKNISILGDIVAPGRAARTVLYRKQI